MTTTRQPPKPIDDNLLHAYIDGELSASEAQRVETRLAGDRNGLARLRAYQQNELALKRLFDPIINEPLPERLLNAVKTGAPESSEDNRQRPRRKAD